MDVNIGITCPQCGRTSHHPEDVREGYCANCHWWTSHPDLAGMKTVLRDAGETPELFGVAREVTLKESGTSGDYAMNRVRQMLRRHPDPEADLTSGAPLYDLPASDATE